LIEGYSPDDIYNADETGFFYKCYRTKPTLFEVKNVTEERKAKKDLQLWCAPTCLEQIKSNCSSLGRARNRDASKMSVPCLWITRAIRRHG
jgi:hypothetical protein